MSEAPIPRVATEPVEGDSDLFTMAHTITSTPTPIKDMESIGVMPGLREHARLLGAVKAWEANPKIEHLLVAGVNPQERDAPTLDFLRSKPIGLQRTEGVVTQVTTENTRTQAQWLLDEAHDRDIDSMALFVSNWHMPRAYSTVIKAMLDQSESRDPIAVFPVSVGVAPGSRITEVAGEPTAMEMSAGEALRIRRYQAVGHVATLPELRTYLDWLWQQKIEPKS